MKSFRKKSGKIILKLVLIPLLIFFHAPHVLSQKFTIPVFPDTQTEIRYSPDMFFSQIHWIAENKDSLHIPIVLHVGDVVDLDNYHQWDIASEGFDILDNAHIPYAIAPGNHDNQSVGRYSRKSDIENTNAALRKTEKFNAYFPYYRFKLQRGRFEPNKSDNAFYTFRAGGLDWLVLALEFGPRKSVINWAENVIEDHPHHNVILLTHYFLRAGGIIGEDTNFGANRSPQELNDLLVKNHKNILMVVSGHTNASAHRVDEGKEGNKIYEILQDYQSRKYDFGGGFLRLLTIDPDAKTITAKMYSPFFREAKSDSSHFSFSNVEFVEFPQ